MSTTTTDLSLLALAAAVAVPWGPLRPEPGMALAFQDHLAAVTAGTQCRYADGSKAVVLKTRRPKYAVFIYREQLRAGRTLAGESFRASYRDTLVELDFDRAGKYQFEANGGQTTYHMIELAADHLLKQTYTPLAAKTLDRFLNRTDVPKCARATFDADLYDKR